MILTGKQLVEKKIITGLVPSDNIQQVGVDLNIIKIERMSGHGVIPVEGKTTLVEYINQDLDKNNQWQLQPGAYNITLEQGCKIPNNVTLLIRQRSSLLRNGTIIHSSVFDPGFETNNIGTIMIVNHPIFIEKGARVGQIYGHENYIVSDENLYAGQFQLDSQREK